MSVISLPPQTLFIWASARDQDLLQAPADASQVTTGITARRTYSWNLFSESLRLSDKMRKYFIITFLPEGGEKNQSGIHSCKGVKNAF